jgi:hypothetical protein
VRNECGAEHGDRLTSLLLGWRVRLGVDAFS